ncbi:MAG: NAD(P)-dependent oxidoreductase [Candidatus Limnocylindrales bacterium]
MRLTVFGATGRTGRPIVEQALAAGHEVVAFARDPAKLSIAHERLTAVQGDATDPSAVERAVEGADAVISVMATSGSQRIARTGPLTRGTQNILAAMEKYGVRRLVISSGAPAASDPQDVPDLRFTLLAAAVRLLAPASLADTTGSVRATKASDLDWTVVRMPSPTDAPPTGRVEAGFASRAMGMRIARADAAAFMLREVVECRYLRQTPVICSRSSASRPASG